MVSNITIGQYYPGSSFIHKLDPRTKLLAVLIFITMLFTLSNILSYIFSAICLAVVMHISTIPFKMMLKGLKMILFIAIFTAVLNLFFTPGTVVFELWIIKITREGLIMAVKMSARLTMLIIGASLLTLTTSPLQLTDAIEYILKPFTKIGVPAHEIAMMMTIALRFIPTLLEEMDKIMKAQMARGADFDTGGIIKKAKSLIPLLVPLFISAFRRADDLAVAMESRCYRGSMGRTKLKAMRFSFKDYITLIYIASFALVLILLNIFL